MVLFRVVTGAFYWLISIAVLVLAVGLLLAKQDNQWGIRAFHVETGSMAPSIPAGSLVIVQNQPKYIEGDIITFRMERDQESFVTHRVASIKEDADIGTVRYQTKGDANNAPDPEQVDSAQVVGRVIYFVPYLGIPMGYIRTQMGFTALIVIPATIIVYSEILNIKNEIVNFFKNRRENLKANAS